MSDAPGSIGVAGAGTMGAGIAQLSALAGIDTWLHDPFPDALERGLDAVGANLDRGAERGRWSPADAAAARDRLRRADALDGLAACELVIEAAPERAELKRDLFARLSDVCAPGTVLATNTSSILVTSLASAAGEPHNVVGMHFFNPPPLMRLLEVVAAEQTGDRALAVARAAGEAMGKHVIVAADGPGFLVNRCGRPFGAEALRLLQEGVATHEQIDRIARLGGGFRMGPFELMDLVGIDVGLEVARSFDAQSFGEPRWKPSPLQARKVAAGTLGRKTGRGWYDYSGDGPYRSDDPPPREPGGGDGRRVRVDGDGALADALRDRARRAGFDVGPDGEPDLVVDAAVRPGPSAGGDPGPAAPLVVLCAGAALAERRRGACGFHLLPPLDSVRLVELTRGPATAPAAADGAVAFFGALGLHHEWVGDAPGLVLGRIVCQLVNEAAFAVGERVGDPAAVDAGMRLGLNHPRGPVEWSRLIGADHALATIDALHADLRDPRYRAAPLLRRRAWPPTS